MFVQTEPTPNPNALKYKANQTLVGEGSVWYDIDLALKSTDFVKHLFRIAGVRFVLLQNDEVTITKFPQWPWAEISDKVKNIIANENIYIESGETDQYCTDEICCAVRKIVQEEIRPAVQLDGGDIKFVTFDNGVVEMQMHGSCWGCTNNEDTLGAIYNKLASKIPEVKQVKIV
jgi:NFU1 iron-sulfur cluster scaffold homolog, mitochondrial